MPTPPDWPSEEEGRRLLAALSDGGRSASNAFASAFFDPLLRFLRGVFPHADEGLAVTAIGQAVMDLIERPDRYDPARGTLASYLRMSAAGDLRNLSSSDGKRRARAISLESVEDVPDRGNQEARGDDGPTWGHPRLAEELAALDPGQQVTLELMRAGERRTDVFARALALDPTSPDTVRAVKRTKDTIMARLRRAGGRS